MSGIPLCSFYNSIQSLTNEFSNNIYDVESLTRATNNEGFFVCSAGTCKAGLDLKYLGPCKYILCMTCIDRLKRDAERRGQTVTCPDPKCQWSHERPDNGYRPAEPELRHNAEMRKKPSKKEESEYAGVRDLGEGLKKLEKKGEAFQKEFERDGRLRLRNLMNDAEEEIAKLEKAKDAIEKEQAKKAKEKAKNEKEKEQPKKAKKTKMKQEEEDEDEETNRNMNMAYGVVGAVVGVGGAAILATPLIVGVLGAGVGAAAGYAIADIEKEIQKIRDFQEEQTTMFNTAMCAFKKVRENYIKSIYDYGIWLYDYARRSLSSVLHILYSLFFSHPHGD